MINAAVGMAVAAIVALIGLSVLIMLLGWALALGQREQGFNHEVPSAEDESIPRSVRERSQTPPREPIREWVERRFHLESGQRAEKLTDEIIERIEEHNESDQE